MSPNDASLRSFVEVAPDCDFPIQNLPYGVFATDADPAPRIGVAIGDFVLDLAVLHGRGLLAAAGGENVFARDALNDFMALGPAVWSATRARIGELLGADTPTLRDDAALRARALVPRASARMLAPFRVQAFSDFYSSRQHATNAGRSRSSASMALEWAGLDSATSGGAMCSLSLIRSPLS